MASVFQRVEEERESARKAKIFFVKIIGRERQSPSDP